MATYKSSSKLSGNFNLASPVSIKTKVSKTDEYPCGTIQFTSGLMWQLVNFTWGLTYSFEVLLCDQNNTQSYPIMYVELTAPSEPGPGEARPVNIATSTPSQGTIRGALGLSNTALYIRARCYYVSNNSITERNNATQNFSVFTDSYVTVNSENMPSASTFTTSDVEFGQSASVTISNPYIARLIHEVTFQIDSTHKRTVTGGTGQSFISWLIPTSWMETASSANSVNMTVSVKTREGPTQIGDVATQTVQAIVPASILPTAGTIKCTPVNPIDSSYSGNQYVRGVSGVRIEPDLTAQDQFEPGEYSSIASYNLTVSKSETVTDLGSGVFVIQQLANSGTINFSMTVTDARGRTSATAATASITSQEYNPPAIVSFTAERCTQNGTLSATGTWAAITAVVNYSAVGGNTLTINSKYYLQTTPGTKYVAWNGMASGTTYIVGDGNFAINSTYCIEVTATDTAGNTATTMLVVPTAPYSIHVKNGGLGVAFGKASEINNSVEISPTWDLYYHGSVLTLPSVMTGAGTSTAGTSGLVPAPAAGDNDNFLKGDGTWGSVPTPPDPTVVFICDMGTVTSLPVTEAYDEVTADMTVIAYEIGTPNAFTSALTVTTAAGEVTLSGTMATSGSSTVVLKLCKAQDATPTVP